MHVPTMRGHLRPFLGPGRGFLPGCGFPGPAQVPPGDLHLCWLRRFRVETPSDATCQIGQEGPLARGPVDLQVRMPGGRCRDLRSRWTLRVPDRIGLDPAPLDGGRTSSLRRIGPRLSRSSGPIGREARTGTWSCGGPGEAGWDLALLRWHRSTGWPSLRRWYRLPTTYHDKQNGSDHRTMIGKTVVLS